MDRGAWQATVPGVAKSRSTYSTMTWVAMEATKNINPHLQTSMGQARSETLIVLSVCNMWRNVGRSGETEIRVLVAESATHALKGTHLWVPTGGHWPGVNNKNKPIWSLWQPEWAYYHNLNDKEQVCLRLYASLQYVNPDPPISRTCLHNHCTQLSPRQRIPGKWKITWKRQDKNFTWKTSVPFCLLFSVE